MGNRRLTARFRLRTLARSADHPLEGEKILADKGYSEEIRYSIKTHCGYLPDCPRVSQMDKALFACDELAGFIMACAYVRPEGLDGIQAKSVKKKLKQKAFAAAVNRDDITNGAEELGVDLTEHINFVIAAMQNIKTDLGFE